MKQSKQIIKELALLFGFALGILLVLTLIAGVRSLLGGSFGGSLWRLGAFIGAIIPAQRTAGTEEDEAVDGELPPHSLCMGADTGGRSADPDGLCNQLFCNLIEGAIG